MKVGSTISFNVIDGEPQLGKQYETDVTVEREEFIEALVDAFLNDCTVESDEFDVTDGDYTIGFTLGSELSTEEIDNIVTQMNIHLLDDDYGSGKDHDLVYDIVDNIIKEDWEHTETFVEMR